ncbi:hypothetical protein BJY04DRAFT_205817 [Aspergillus karnatakaensis]|uniref:uncharacterized protein n=1 Tax=Aspergillus karnatakaensis TaxID=1810916 RepID=UPI003CCC9B73
MLAPTAGNVSLRTVSSSRPQLFRTESQQSAAASDDYFSLSSRTTATRSASGASEATIMRYATPNSHPVSQISSPAVSRTLLAPPPPAVPRAEQNAEILAEPRQTFVTNIDSGSQSTENKGTEVELDGTRGKAVRDSYAGREPTPGMDDSPYIRFAINQLTHDDDPRRSSDSARETAPTGRLLWDGGLGQFVRAVTPPAQQQLPPQFPRDRSPQASVDPEAFVAVDPPEGNLIYPPLDFVPVVLRPWALSIVILCVLLMIAGIGFSNAWSRDHQGLWEYDGRGGSRYFVVQFLPQLLGILISLLTFVIQAAVYRIMPFAIMASERPFKKTLQALPTLPKNFLLPDLSQVINGETLVGFALFTIWLSNFIAVPLLSCFFQAKWFAGNADGEWRWAAVRSVGWALIAIYTLLALGLILLMLRFFRTWSGLMWDPVCLADLITVIQRSNVLPDFEDTETTSDVSTALRSRALRLGYWQLSQGRSPEVFYGIGEPGATVGNPSLHIGAKYRRDHVSKVSFDAEKNGSQDLYSPSIRYQWAPWFLRRAPVIIWTMTICALFIAFVVVSFVNNAVEEGFPPRLTTRPSSSAFSSSNFLYSFIPALIGNCLFLAWQHIDLYFRALQPFAMLSSPEGASAEQSLLLAYPSLLPIHVTITAVTNKHYKVAWISLISVISGAIPILAGGVFIALTYPGNEIKIASLMPAFYAIVVFCAIYMASFISIWPGRRRYLPHDIGTLADQMSFLYQSPLLSDKLLREPRSKTDLVTRLVITPPGDRDYPRYGFGIPGGLYLPMEDTVTALFFNSYIYTPRDPMVRMGSMELLPQLYAAAPFSSHLHMSSLAVAFFSVAAWTRQGRLLQEADRFFGKALSRTRQALQGDVEQNYDEILMTLMLLYIYECFTSIKENKPSPKHHLRGAIAVINSCGSRRPNTPLADTLTNAVQKEIILTATTNSQVPLFKIPEVWPLSPPVPQLASSRLTMISTKLVELRERWEGFAARTEPMDLSEVESILFEARLIDDQFSAWTLSLPKHWDPAPASSIPESVRDAGLYQGRCDCYTDSWIAETWNEYRTYRLAVQNIIFRCLCLLSNCADDIQSTTETIYALAVDICATVPFFLGSQTGSMRITDHRVEYPQADWGRTNSASRQQTAPLVGGWFVIYPLQSLCSAETLPDDLVKWAHGQVNETNSNSVKMVLSWFTSSSSPIPSGPEPTFSSPSSPPPSPPPPPPPQQQQPPAEPPKEDLPKLWTPQTNTKLFFGGALFFTLSLLTTRRALVRRFNAMIPPYYTSSIYHKPKVNGGGEAFEALHLATINVLSFAMMASGGVLWAMGVNSLDDMRSYVRKRMLEGHDHSLGEADKVVEKDLEEWVAKYLGKRIEDGKLKDLEKGGGGSGGQKEST